MIGQSELPHLRRCVEPATRALELGDEPFGSVLVSGDGAALAEDHNRVASGDRTRHPEFAPVRSLPVDEVAPGVVVEGPVPEPAEEVHELHRRYHE